MLERILGGAEESELARLVQLGAAALYVAGRGAVNSQDRLAYTRQEAAAVLGVSVDFFDEHVRPSLRSIRLSRLILFPRSELERWVEEYASLAIEE
jgi:excisionase family DNA binding protein